MGVYVVYSKDNNSELMAIFTTLKGAEDFVSKYGGMICVDEAYESLRDYEAAQVF